MIGELRKYGNIICKMAYVFVGRSVKVKEIPLENGSMYLPLTPVKEVVYSYVSHEVLLIYKITLSE